MERYDSFCAAAGRSETLDESFASLSLGFTNDSTRSAPLRQHAAGTGVEDDLDNQKNSKELSVITMAMRKIREAIIATSRTDAFATRAYTFIIRATILEKYMESYYPALLYLLRKFYHSPLLSASEKHESIGYYILDLACRQEDLAEAYRARNMYDYRDTQVESVLKALVQGNWFIFWNMGQQVDKYQQRLMEFGEGTMRKHALKCLGRSYLNIKEIYLQRATSKCWEELKEQENLGWQQDGEMIIIKQIKKK